MYTPVGRVRQYVMLDTIMGTTNSFAARRLDIIFGINDAPWRIFICSRGSNASAKGNLPVNNAYNMMPSAHISCAG